MDRKLLESIVNGGNPDTGGICTDDDMPTGTTVFGDKMVPVRVSNRLTGETIKYVPADDLDQTWNYDEFDHTIGMGSHKAYSKTLKSLGDLLGDRLWKRTDLRKFRLGAEKWAARIGSADGGVKQTAKLSDDDEETMDTPELETDMDLMEKIDLFLDEDVPDTINEDEISIVDRKALAKLIIRGKNHDKIKINSLGVDAIVSHYDDEIVITFKPNDDFTVALVDISDSLGMEFNKTKDGGKTAFRMMK